MADKDLTVQPDQLGLGEVIERLKRDDPARLMPIGFSAPHSYRGYYEELAFELRRDITIGEMLAAAESALGATYQGWKGGYYEMRDHTTCWLVKEEGYCGESIGAVFLELLLAGGAS